MLLECVGVRERVLYDFLRLECENLKMKIYKINVKRKVVACKSPLLLKNEHTNCGEKRPEFSSSVELLKSPEQPCRKLENPENTCETKIQVIFNVY